MAKNLKRIIAGRKSQAKGQGFEHFIMDRFQRFGWMVKRVPSGAKWVGRNRIIPIKSPFDFLAIKNGICIFFDAKRTSAKSLPSSMIKQHQQDHLQDCLDWGCAAGFVVHFEARKEIWFYSPDLKESFKIGGEMDANPDAIVFWFTDRSEPRVSSHPIPENKPDNQT